MTLTQCELTEETVLNKAWQRSEFFQMDNEMNSIARDGLSVYGYIRENFERKCLIQEIITIIIQFFKTNGFLFVCGNGKYGCLGINEYYDKECMEPTRVQSVNGTSDIAVGYSHTMALDNEGRVWAFGSGEDGKLGTGNTENAKVPQQINLKQRAIAISVGYYHSLILVADGFILSCGRNNNGQLGHGNTKSELVPKVIESLKEHKITQISAGAFHNGAVSEKGDLFMWGSNGYGQCGVGEASIYVPTMIKLNKKVLTIECGDYHCLLITMQHLLYSWGCGDCGQLGHGNKEYKDVPTLIETLKGVKVIKASGGYEHSLCIDDEFHVWAFGSNAKGQCEQSEHTKEQTTPKRIGYFTTNNIKVKEVKAGWEASCVISHNNECFVFGNNDDHQIGLEETKNYYEPTKLPLFVQKASMGKFHSAFIGDHKKE